SDAFWHAISAICTCFISPSSTLSPLLRPPIRRRIACRNLGAPKRHQMAALIWIAAHFRAILTPHTALQLMDRRRLRSPHDVESDGLMRVTTEAANLKVGVPRIERVTACATAAPDP